MGSSRQRQQTTQTTNQTQNTTTPGTAYGTGLLNDPRLKSVQDQVFGGNAFQGDRIAAPGDLSVANYGALPSTFTPTPGATAAPGQVHANAIDPNYQPGIQAGLNAAGGNAVQGQPIVNNTFGWLNNLSQGPETPEYLRLRDSINSDADRAQTLAANRTATLFGDQGAYGGTNMADALSRSNEDQARAREAALSGLGYQNLQGWQGLMANTPQMLSNLYQTQAMPAEQLLRYGGLGQENLQNNENVRFQNAEADAFNTWQGQELADRQAQAQTQDALQKFLAQFQVDQQAAANQNAIAGRETEQAQTGMDNAYLNWLAQQEFLNNQLQQIGGLFQFGQQVPGQTSNLQGTTNSTTTSSQTAAPWQIAAGLGSAALSAFGGPGGMFSGGLSALGGLGKGAASMGGGAMATGNINPWPWLTGGGG